ncbi:hypothetical protein [Streptomyces sp. NPDC002994]|uniref:hypothetical protein n=1 Tax=Streptomyces sp. NPDC002994 TaxID=3154441 RepID=UPI0033B31EF6
MSATACGQDDGAPQIWTEPPRTHSDTLPRSWVGGASDEVVLIQITQDGTKITGTLNGTELEGNGRLDVDQGAFTGTTQNGAITLLFETGLGTQRSISGTVTSTEMVLNHATKSGGMETYTLRPGTIDEYNARVADLGNPNSNSALNS